MVSERISISRNSYKIVRDPNICLLETSSSDSFSNKHGFGLCTSSASKPTLSLDLAQKGEGGGPLSLPQHRQESGGEQPKTSLLTSLCFASMSLVLRKAVISAVGFCPHSRGSEVPAPATVSCCVPENRTGVCVSLLARHCQKPESSHLTQNFPKV